MRQGELVRVFEEKNVVDPEDYPRGVALRLLTRIGTLYERLGLMSESKPEPLWRCCPHGAECWAGATKPRRGSKVNDGRITLPWIGPAYEQGGVVVIAINLHNASGLLTEYSIVCSSAGTEDHPSQIGSFEASRKQAHRSPFAYRSVRTAAMLLDDLDGLAIRDRSEPSELIAPINRIARLQAVKCAPVGGRRGSPTSTMRQNCPPLLLRAELAILQPSVILTVGGPAEHAIKQLPGYTSVRTQGATKRATSPVEGETCTIFSVAHPVSPAAWQADHGALMRHLRSKQRRHAVDLLEG